MARVSSLSRIASVGALAALTVLGTLAAPTSASAKPMCHLWANGKLHCFSTPDVLPPSPLPVTINKYGNGWGYGAAALGGMAVGMIAASAAQASATASDGGDCSYVRRQAVDEDGNLYVKRVRVCQ